MTSYDILVIILSSFLAIFIALAITATILVIKLINTLRGVVAKGEHLVDTAVDSAEEISETFKRNANAVNIIKIITNAVGATKSKHK